MAIGKQNKQWKHEVCPHHTSDLISNIYVKIIAIPFKASVTKLTLIVGKYGVEDSMFLHRLR